VVIISSGSSDGTGKSSCSAPSLVLAGRVSAKLLERNNDYETNVDFAGTKTTKCLQARSQPISFEATMSR